MDLQHRAWPPMQQRQWKGQFFLGGDVSRQTIIDFVGTKYKNMHWKVGVKGQIGSLRFADT